jgi:hypothetical protein
VAAIVSEPTQLEQHHARLAFGASGYGQARKAQFDERYFGRDPKGPAPQALDETADADAWRRERERREQHGR